MEFNIGEFFLRTREIGGVELAEFGEEQEDCSVKTFHLPLCEVKVLETHLRTVVKGFLGKIKALDG